MANYTKKGEFMVVKGGWEKGDTRKLIVVTIKTIKA